MVDFSKIEIFNKKKILIITPFSILSIALVIFLWFTVIPPAVLNEDLKEIAPNFNINITKTTSSTVSSTTDSATSSTISSTTDSSISSTISSTTSSTVSSTTDSMTSSTISSTTSSTISSTTSSTISSTTNMNTVELISRGQLIRIDSLHHGSGTIQLVRDPSDNSYQVYFVDVNIMPGPRLVVYLSDISSPTDTNIGNFINLGPLKAQIGTFTMTALNYDTKTIYKSLIIWCEPFSVVFTYANLSSD